MTLSARLPQLPGPGQVFLDHVGCFTPDIGAIADALSGLDIAMTPFTEQQNNGRPAGTANRCAMLGRGYIEVLTPVGPTPLADQMRAAIDRYAGLHLICFTTADPAGTVKRIETAGFAMQPPVDLARETDDGPARFTVLRLAENMPEGRIQFCTHYTPDTVWPARHMRDGNRSRSLTGALVVSRDPEEAAARFARFTGRPARQTATGWRLDLDRGCVGFADAATAADRFGLAAPDLPWIAAVAVADTAITQEQTVDAGVLRVVLHAPGSPPDWLS